MLVLEDKRNEKICFINRDDATIASRYPIEQKTSSLRETRQADRHKLLNVYIYVCVCVGRYIYTHMHVRACMPQFLSDYIALRRRL